MISLRVLKNISLVRCSPRDIFFPHKKRNFVSLAAVLCSIYYINTNEIPNHFTLIVFWCERRDLSFSHRNGDIFTCEDIKFSSKSSPGISLVSI